MDIPCKLCVAYAACQYKTIWNLIAKCPRFRLYVRVNTIEWPHPWTRTLRSFQRKGEE